MLLVFMIYISGILLLQTVEGANVYICTKGNDHMLCGTNLLNCCRTLKYTLEAIANANDTVFLDGGRKEPKVYFIEIAVVLTQSVRVSKSPLSRFNPVLVKNKTSSDSEEYVFFVHNINTANGIELTIESIEFRDINMIYCLSSICHLTILRCIHHMPANILNYIVFVNMEEEDHDEDLAWFHVDDSAGLHVERSTILIKRSRFFSFPQFYGKKTTIFLKNVPTLVTISKTAFQGGQIYMANTRSSTGPFMELKVKNVIFYDSEQFAISVVGNFDSVNILRTEFRNVTYIYKEHEDYLIEIFGGESGKRNVKIINSLFTRCGTQLPDVIDFFLQARDMLQLYNVHFLLKNLELHKNNGNQTNIYIQNSNGTMHKLSMTYNSVVIMVEISSSSVRIHDCQFINNTLLRNELTFAVHLHDSDTTLTNLTIVENTCSDLFKIVYDKVFANPVWRKNKNTITISHVKVIKNKASSFISCTNEVYMTEISINHVLVDKNTFYSDLYVVENSFDTLLWINNSNFTNNFISNHLVCVKYSHLTMENVTILQNTYKTGFNLIEVSARLFSVSMKHNQASGSPREIYISSPKMNAAGFVTILNDVTIFSMETKDESIKQTTSLVKLETHNFLKMDNLTLHLHQKQFTAIEISFDVKRPDFINDLTACIKCPAGTNPINSTVTHGLLMLYTIKCSQCDNWLYSTVGGKIRLNNVVEKTKAIHAINHTLFPTECKECPIGGICQNGITRSRGNFYGFKRKDETILYLPCPVGYCCSSRETCYSHNTCQALRTGTLCGKCQRGFHENMFSNGCIANDKCKHQTEYWIIYVSCVTGLAIVITVLDKIIGALTPMFIKIKQLLLSKKQSNKDIADATSTIYETERPRSIIILTTGLTEQLSRRVFSLTRGASLAKTLSPLRVSTSTNFRTLSDYSSCNSSNFNTYQHSISTQDRNSTHDRNSSYDGSSTHDSNSTQSSNVTQDSSSTRQEISNPDSSNNKDNNNKPYTFSGLFVILLSFYQIKSLLTVQLNDGSPTIMSTISDFFNFNIIANIGSSVCPSVHIDIVAKYFIKDFLFNILVPLFLLVIISVFQVLKTTCFTKSVVLQIIINQLGLGYMRCLLSIYKNIASYCLTMITCVSLNDKNVLFIQGDRECFQQWQYAVIALLACWVLPFPFALFTSYKLYRQRRLSYRSMMTCLTVPFTTPLVWWLTPRYCITKVDIETEQRNETQFETIKELFEESYRLKEGETDEFVFWEHWRLIQRLILGTVTTIVISPLERICYSVPCILVFIIVYMKVRPYKSHLMLLHWCEVASLISFCYLLVANLFNAFLFVYSIPTQEPLPKLKLFFVYMEWVCSPLTMLVIYFILSPIYNRLSTKITGLKTE